MSFNSAPLFYLSYLFSSCLHNLFMYKLWESKGALELLGTHNAVRCIGFTASWGLMFLWLIPDDNNEILPSCRIVVYWNYFSFLIVTRKSRILPIVLDFRTPGNTAQTYQLKTPLPEHRGTEHLLTPLMNKEND